MWAGVCQCCRDWRSKVGRTATPCPAPARFNYVLVYEPVVRLDIAFGKWSSLVMPSAGPLILVTVKITAVFFLYTRLGIGSESNAPPLDEGRFLYMPTTPAWHLHPQRSDLLLASQRPPYWPIPGSGSLLWAKAGARKPHDPASPGFRMLETGALS